MRIFFERIIEIKMGGRVIRRAEGRVIRRDLLESAREPFGISRKERARGIRKEFSFPRYRELQKRRDNRRENGENNSRYHKNRLDLSPFSIVASPSPEAYSQKPV